MPTTTRLFAVDLGTSTTQVWSAQGEVRRPSLIALDRYGAVVVGDEVRAMQGRTPSGLRVVKPLSAGVVRDLEGCTLLLRSVLREAGAGRRAKVCISVPAGATEVERRSVALACERAIGRSPAAIVSEPLAAAVGAALPVDDVAASMIIDVGEGITEAMVVSAGGVVACVSRRVGGADLDEAIARHVRERYRVAIGDSTAEAMKLALTLEPSRPLVAGGRDLRTGLPVRVEVDLVALVDTLDPIVQRIVGTASDVLTRTPPELCGDLVDAGIVVSGGGSMLPGLVDTLAEATGLAVRLADGPQQSVLRGNVRVLLGETSVTGTSRPVRPLR